MISPWKSLPAFLKEPILAMLLLLFAVFEPATTAASMAIERPETIAAAPLAGRSAAEDGGGETFLFREECPFRGRGKKSTRRRCGPRRSRRSRSLARSAIMRRGASGR